MVSFVPVIVSGTRMSVPKPLLQHLPCQYGDDNTYKLAADPDLMYWMIYYHQHASLPSGQDWTDLEMLANQWKIGGLSDYLEGAVPPAVTRKRSLRNLFVSNKKQRSAMTLDELVHQTDVLM